MKKLLFPCLLGLVFILLLISFVYDVYIPKNSNGIISLTFDDGFLSQYSSAYPEMQKYGFNGTAYILANWSSSFEGRELINFQQARELQEAGWEIGSHGLNHKSLVGLSELELNDELKLSKEILEGEELNITSLSLPFGYYNDLILKKASKDYSSSRLLLSGYNELDRIEPFKLKSKWIKSEYLPKKICSWIKYSKDRGVWLVIDFHSIEGKEERPWDESIKDFREVLQCINDSKIEVKTIREVINKYGKEI